MHISNKRTPFSPFCGINDICIKFHFKVMVNLKLIFQLLFYRKFTEMPFLTQDKISHMEKVLSQIFDPVPSFDLSEKTGKLWPFFNN